MADDTLENLIGEPGVRDIWVGYIPGSRDIKRINAARATGIPFPRDVIPPVWDFFILRGGGGRSYFHSNMKGEDKSTVEH